jgi:hypothetical protein
VVDEAGLSTRFAALAPFLDERLRRVWAAAEARAIGRGGIEVVHRVTGLAHKTIRAGVADLDDEELQASGRVRRPGGGRTAEVVKDPALVEDPAGAGRGCHARGSAVAAVVGQPQRAQPQ